MPHSTPLQLQLFEDVPKPPGTGEAVARPAPVGPVAGKSLLARLNELHSGRFRSVTLTDNRSTIVSARESTGGLDVRIHRCFERAPDEVVRAVAGFLLERRRSAARRRALAAIREHFQRRRPEPGVPRRRRIVLRPVGRRFDLRVLRDGLNARYFEGRLAVHVTWGRALPRGRRGRSVRLGTYSDRDRVVRIHRCLDRADVPRFVVEAVVYHEMLHAAVPPVVVGGRRRIHTPEFRRRERLFTDHDKAERWLERNLSRLLGSR